MNLKICGYNVKSVSMHPSHRDGFSWEITITSELHQHEGEGIWFDFSHASRFNSPMASISEALNLFREGVSELEKN